MIKKNYLILPLDLDEYKNVTYEDKKNILEFAEFILKDKKRKNKEE